jgi:hypothetical protein
MLAKEVQFTDLIAYFPMTRKTFWVSKTNKVFYIACRSINA